MNRRRREDDDEGMGRFRRVRLNDEEVFYWAPEDFRFVTAEMARIEKATNEFHHPNFSDSQGVIQGWTPAEFTRKRNAREEPQDYKDEGLDVSEDHPDREAFRRKRDHWVGWQTWHNQQPR
jgi:hypothetical protein